MTSLTDAHMYHQEFDPPEELRDSIKCFWYNRRDFGKSGSSFEVLPDGYAEIIFYFGNGCSISLDGESRPLPSPFIMGLLDKPVILTTKNNFEIIAIRCFPWTVFDLLEIKPGRKSVHIVEHPIARLQTILSEMIAAGKIGDAVTTVQKYFLESRLTTSPANTLSKAGLAMSIAKGTIPVTQVARAAHASVRTLQRKFMDSSGHTIKNVSGLMRFEQVRNRLWLYPEANIAGLAFELGYTDQSHLSKDFKRYSGNTPAAFARKAKKDKQMTNNFVALQQAE